MDEHVNEPTDDHPVSRLDLLFLIYAYNRKELSLDDWMALSRQWAEAMQQRYAEGTNETSDAV